MDREADLFARRAEPRARAELAELHDGLATRLARRFARRGQPLEDLEQVARMALVAAIDRFDVEREVQFATYATRTIVGELKRHLRDKDWAIRVPRSLQERWLEVGSVTQLLTQRLGRSPTFGEIAAEIGCAVEEVIEAVDAGGGYRAMSVDAPMGDDDAPTLADTLGDDDATITDGAERVTVAALLAALPDRERAIVVKTFYESKTQSEIAAELGISQMHVSRLLRASLSDLRNRMDEA